ncbi:hypothetical protein C8R43DRAFT_946839 [Mycena crocata]|nr:hypothetical protein C8R43DRAFT_946839 [Mycena crocata]
MITMITLNYQKLKLKIPITEAFLFFKKTDMSLAKHPFDLANISLSLLLIGHLGDHITDSHHGSSLHKTKQWETLLSQIPPDLMTTPASRLTVGQQKLKDKIAARMKLLPNDLSPLQRLSLTPSPCLTPDEISLLKSQFGDINLITKYFRTVEMRFCEVPIHLPTFLHKIGKEKQGKIWTVLRPLFMESKKRVVVGFDPIKDQNITQLVSSGQQLWLEVPDSSKFKGLCFWHEGMSDKQKLLMKRNWVAQSQYPEGMRKMDLDSRK